MKAKIEAIREQLDRADASTGDLQIGQILIALSQMLDLIEKIVPAQTEPTYDRLASARQEYQAERRIDEWHAYHEQERD